MIPHESVSRMPGSVPFRISVIFSSATVHMTHNLASAVPLGSTSRWSRELSIWISFGTVVRTRLVVSESRSTRNSEKRNATPLLRSSTREYDSTSWWGGQELSVLWQNKDFICERTLDRQVVEPRLAVTLAQSQIMFHCGKTRTSAPCNTATSSLRSLLLSPMGDRNTEVRL